MLNPASLKAILCAGVAVLAVGAATAQSAPGFAPPKTAWGAPDLQGTWTNASITRMQRGNEFTDLVLTQAQAAKLEGADYYNNRRREDAKPADPNDKTLLDGSDLLSGGGYNGFWVDPGSKIAVVKGELRSSWIVDPPNGKIPYKAGRRGSGARPATAAAAPAAPAKRLNGKANKDGTVQGPGAVDPNAGGGFGSYNGPEARPIGERCLVGFGGTGGPVMNNVLYNNHYQIVQSPAYVMIDIEMDHDARIIPLVKDAAAARHGPEAIPKWLGDSVGWYEGDTLVVETRNVNPQQRGYISAAGKLTERFTRWNKDQILYEFTVDDPTLYSQPWKGEMALNFSKEPLYEYACHEGNYAMKGILAGARAQEKAGKVVANSAAEE
jgi:hypothetical protein